MPNTPPEERDYGFFGLLDKPPEKDSIAYDKFGLRPGRKITKINGKLYKEFLFREELSKPDFYKGIYEYTPLENGKEKTIVIAQNHEIPLSAR
ncbi:MAG: hypothetical protein LBP20_02810 [Treponema sp.]|jgi:hypothetical protein|nr:hypothetical protein [Treponema sp.]